ncbi:MAG: glycosyltransferase family 1 protein [Planctomycetota bacterium]
MTLKVCLLDTAIRGTIGSMHRYRDQLLRGFAEHSADLDVDVRCLGLSQDVFQATPARFRMWRHHLHVWRSAKRSDFSDFDVVHLLDGSFGYVASAVDQQSKTVCTVHDVIPRLQMDGRFPTAPRIGRGAGWLIGRCLKGLAKSHMIVAVSQSSASDLMRFGVRPALGVEVVWNALEPELFQVQRLVARTDRRGKSLDLPERYLLHLGNNGFYKNRKGAYEIFRNMDEKLDMHLVLAGPPLDSVLRDEVVRAGLKDRVIEVVDPSEETVASLYSRACVFVFPSLYEGFGWPPLEAMSVGCPVVSSNAGSLAEVVGSGGIVEESGDYSAMGKACERLIADQGFRDEVVGRGKRHVANFTLQKMSESMAAVYRKVADSHGNGVAR